MDQNFLINESILKREVDYANISKRDIVLEIGSGIGNLTRYLAERAKKVIAVEKDSDLIKILKDVLSGYKNVEIIEGDFLEIDLPKYNKIVSNIPFSLSSEITERIMLSGFDIAVILYQKEFAERLVAKPGDKNYSRITILTNLFSEVNIMEIVSRSNFYPRPDVDAAVVKFIHKKVSYDFDVREFLNFVRKIFVHKKKNLKNALKLSGYRYDNVPKEYLEMKVHKIPINDLILIYKRVKI